MDMVSLHSRSFRWLGSLLATFCYVLSALAAPVLVSRQGAWSGSWPWFLLTTTIALAFFAVGLLVWWYGRKRRVALLFLLVCTSLAFSLMLAVPAEVMDDSFVQVWTSLSASLGIFFLLLLVLHFPHQTLHSWHRGSWRQRLLWGWVSVLGLLSALSVCYCVSGTRFPAASWFEPWYMVYYLGTVLSMLGVLLVQTRLRLGRRERQQLRLLLAGLALGLAPWLCLSILPDLFHALLPALPLAPVEDYWTMPGLLLLPLTLGYTALRYQFLVYDTVVARVVCALMRGVALVMCVYLGLTCLLLVPHTILWVLAAAFLCTGCSIGAWMLADVLTMKVLFAEMQQDRSLILSTLAGSSKTDDLLTIARTIEYLLSSLCGSQRVGVLVRDEASGLYHLANEPATDKHTALLETLNALCAAHYPAPPRAQWALTREVQVHLSQARRPSFLREVALRQPLSGEQYEMVLVGLRAGDVVQGVLVLDARGDLQPYAGSDFEVLRELSSRVLSLLTSALDQEAKTTQTAIVEEGLRQTTLLGRLGPEDYTVGLAALMARFLPAQVEVWERREQVWYRLALAGSHPYAWSTEQSRQFLAGGREHQMPLFEAEGLLDHPLPLVLLPLEQGPIHHSHLLAHYSRPSLLLPERRQMLALAGLHARHLLEAARTRATPVEKGLAPALLAALPSLEDLLQEVPAPRLQTHLADSWRILKHLEPRWLRSTPLPTAPHSSRQQTVMLVINHPLLAPLLRIACEWDGYTVITHATVRESLSWLRHATRSLVALIIDEAALSLDVELFAHAVSEYLPTRPQILVCLTPAFSEQASRHAEETSHQHGALVTHLFKPLTLAQVLEALHGAHASRNR